MPEICRHAHYSAILSILFSVTILKTMKFKKYTYFLTLIFIASACAFQEPDYLEMIDAAELNQIMAKEDIFLMDVHTPKQAHIKGTDVFVPYNEVKQYQDKLPKDKNTPIYLYCEGGPMGNAAARTLHDLGYNKLINLKGGARAWRGAGFKFE